MVVSKQSFTYMSVEGTQAIKDANATQVDKYTIELNKTDFNRLIDALVIAFCSPEWDDIDTSDWAGDFISSIGQTLGIEFI